jgi:hypothetical protein
MHRVLYGYYIWSKDAKLASTMSFQHIFVNKKLNVEIFKFAFLNSKIFPIIAIRFLRVKNRI